MAVLKSRKSKSNRFIFNQKSKKCVSVYNINHVYIKKNKILLKNICWLSGKNKLNYFFTKNNLMYNLYNFL